MQTVQSNFVVTAVSGVSTKDEHGLPFEMVSSL